MYHRLQHFVESRGLLSELQFGFRKHGRSSNALKVVDDAVLSNQSDGHFTALLSFNIKGAFDSVQ